MAIPLIIAAAPYIAAGAAAIGGIASGVGTANAQSAANRANALAAAQQSAQSFLNNLSSRGLNIQQIIANDPRGPTFWQDQYQQSVARGDRRDFNTWFAAAVAAAPSDAIWDQIANPSSGNSQNTTLPAYAQIGGQQAQPVIADQAGKLFADQQAATQAAQASAVAKQWLATGGANLVNVYNSDPQYAAMFGSLDNFVLADFNANATPEQKQLITQQATAVANPGAVNPATLTAQQEAVNTNITNLVNGTNLASNLAGLQPALDARTTAANLQQDLINEQRGAATHINDVQQAGLTDILNTRTTGATGIYDSSVAGAQGISAASLAGLQQLLGTRQQGAQDIYGATVSGAGGLRDAQIQAARGISEADLAGLRNLLGVQETGARNVYGAQLTQADTYAQSAQQAMQAQLAQQQANRARQGFTGTSSGSDLERARLMAQYLQAGAGARAGAGVTLEQSLANSRQSNSQSQLQDAIALATGVGAAGTGYAANVGNAGVGRATSLAGAQEQNSIGQLQTGVNLATSLGNAGTTRATTVAGANEQAATGRLGANTQLATTQAGLLDTNAKLAKAQADFQNAMDTLNLSIAGQKDMLSGSGMPNANAASTLSLAVQDAQAKYRDLAAYMSALGPLSINNASGPTITTAQPGAVVSPWQIAGSGLTAAGTMIGSDANTAALIKLLGSSGGSNAGLYNSGTNPYPLGQSPVFGVRDSNPFVVPTGRT